MMVVIFSGVSFADMFLKVDGVNGSSTDASHNKWVNVIGLKDGDVRSGSSRQITVIAAIDRALPLLTKDCIDGASHPSAVIEVTKGSVVAYRITLTNVRIEQCSYFSDKGSSAEPAVAYTLAYSKILHESLLSDAGGDKTNIDTTFEWNSSGGSIR